MFTSNRLSDVLIQMQEGAFFPLPPNKNFELGSSVFREFFSNLTEVLNFLKMSKKRSNYEISVFLRNYEGAKKGFFRFWLFLTKILVTG